MISDSYVCSEVTAFLEKLRQKQITAVQLQYHEGCETKYGVYGFVRKATLDQVGVVAVKAFLPAGGREQRTQLVLTLARELSIWEPLSHPNILSLTNFHVSDDFAVTLFVSPWAAGGHIEEYIEKQSPDLETKISLALDTAAGLKFLHDKKICHGDLKPENVVVFDGGCAVLCDFGLAVAIQENAKRTGLTTTTARNEPQVIIPYASPELILEAGASHTPSSDVWAWGCLLLEILTAVLPYAACAGTEHLHELITRGKLPADVYELQLASDLKTLLLRCWNTNQEDRPTIEECFARLIAAEVTLSVADSPQSQNLSSYQQVRVLYTSQRRQRLEGESSSAEQALIQAKDKLLELGNSFGVVLCDSNLASVERSKCEFNSARIQQEKVLETFHGINAAWGVALSRYELGVIDAKQGKNDSARNGYQEALKAFQQLADPSGVASCQRAIGTIDAKQGKYQEAQLQFQAALEAYRRLGDRSGVASCWLRLGTLDLYRGKYDAAEALFHQALDAFRQLGNPSGMALCRQKLGRLKFYLGKYDEARSHGEEALSTFLRLGDPSEVAWCQRDLGVTDCALEKYDDAFNRAEEALATFQRLGEPSGIAACLYDIGVIACEKRNYIFAKKKLLDALELEVQLGDLSNVAYCKGELGGVEYRLYNFDTARSLLQEAIEIFQLLNDPRGEAESQRNLGLVDFEEGKHDDAHARFQKALKAHERLGTQSGVEFCHEAFRKIQDAKSKDSHKFKTINWP